MQQFDKGFNLRMLHGPSSIAVLFVTVIITEILFQFTHLSVIRMVIFMIFISCNFY